MVISRQSTSRLRLEVLDESECLRLLRGEGVGRLGFSAAALPIVLPVNFTLDGSRAIFATEEGTKLNAARHHSVACLEVDSHENMEHTGWSVIATGRLSELSGAAAERAAELPLTPWAIDGAPCHYVELEIELLSGRRIIRP